VTWLGAKKYIEDAVGVGGVWFRYGKFLKYANSSGINNVSKKCIK